MAKACHTHRTLSLVHGEEQGRRAARRRSYCSEQVWGPNLHHGGSGCCSRQPFRTCDDFPSEAAMEGGSGSGSGFNGRWFQFRFQHLFPGHLQFPPLSPNRSRFLGVIFNLTDFEWLLLGGMELPGEAQRVLNYAVPENFTPISSVCYWCGAKDNFIPVLCFSRKCHSQAYWSRKLIPVYPGHKSRFVPGRAPWNIVWAEMVQFIRHVGNNCDSVANLHWNQKEPNGKNMWKGSTLWWVTDSRCH